MTNSDTAAENEALPTEARLRELLDMDSTEILRLELILAYRKGLWEGLRYPTGRPETTQGESAKQRGLKHCKAKKGRLIRWLKRHLPKPN